MRGEDLTSEDAFDFIYAQISLHEMDDARVVLANARRALKEDGILLVTEIRGAERIEDCVGAYNAVLSHIDLFYEIPQAVAKGGHAVGFFARRVRGDGVGRGVTGRARVASRSAAVRRVRGVQVAARGGRLV